MSNSIDRRERRRKAWIMLDDDIQYKIPSDYHSYMSEEIEEYAKQQWAKTRVTHFDAQAGSNFFTENGLIIQLVVALIGAGVFASIPGIILSQQNQSEGTKRSLATAGGAVAGFVAHYCACQVLVGLRLKQSYEQAEETIKKG